MTRQTTCSTDLLSGKDLECKPKPLLKELRPVAAKYHGLGIQLGISPAKIREFEAEASGQDVQRFLREVLDRWLGGDPQLGVLVDGLIEIGNRRLAEKVEVDYQGRFSTCLSPPKQNVKPKVVTAVSLVPRLLPRKTGSSLGTRPNSTIL